MDVEGEANNTRLAVHGENVRFVYPGRKKETVISDLNITVGRGIIYGLLGPSGCGKTTLLKCIVGRLRPTDGTIKVFGKIPGQKGFSIPGPGVGFMPQELALYNEVTIDEILTYFGRLYQMSYKEIKERIAFLKRLLDIPEKKKQIRNLSGGQQRRVSFAVALIHKPPLLILDEPTVGVDPMLRENIWVHLLNLASNDHLTIIITTHYIEEARKAHMVGLMRNGRLLAEMNPQLLMKKYGLNSLDDVFLKLCFESKQNQSIKGKPDHYEHNNIENNTNKLENNINSCDKTKKQSEITNKELENYELHNLENNINYEDKSKHSSVIWVQRKTNDITCEDDCINTGCEYGEASLLNKCNEIQVKIVKNGYGKRSNFLVSMTRISALINKNIIRFKRDLFLLSFQIFLPSLLVVLFCLCMGGPPHSLPIAIVNMEEEDPSGMGKEFLKRINNYTIHQTRFTNLSIALESVKRGEHWGVIYLGPSYTDSLVDRYLQGIYVDNETVQNSTLRLYLDMTNQQISGTILMELFKGFLNFSEAMLVSYHQNKLLAQPPISLEEPVYGEREPELREFMAPGMISGIVYIMTMSLSVMSIITEKKEGLLDRSWMAGVRSWEVIFSFMVTLSLMVIMQVILVLLTTFLIFDIPSHGPFIWVVIAVILIGVSGMSFGLLLSAFCADECSAIIIATAMFYPNILLSGIVWPVQAMPYLLKQVSFLLPLTLICNTLRSILSRGWTITQNGIWDGFVVSLGWISFSLFLAILIFKYKK